MMACTDHVALGLQIEEVRGAVDFLVAQRLALALMGDLAEEFLSLYLAEDVDDQLEVLEVQLEDLVAQQDFLHAQALSDGDARAAQQEQEALLQVVRAATEEEKVAQHDRQFAVALSKVEKQQWEESGDLMERPLAVGSGTEAAVAAAAATRKLLLAACPPCLSHSSAASAGKEAAVAAAAAPAASAPAAAVVSSDCEQAAAAAAASGGPQLQCSICFEDHPRQGMVSAQRDPGEPCSSSSDPSCLHYFCRACMKRYVQTELQNRKYPLLCPSSGCRRRIQQGDLHDLLDDCTSDLQVLRRLEVEHTIGIENCVYCPYKDCSSLLVNITKEERAHAGPTLCPDCEREFCPSCRITGWHQGFTCEAFVALPAHLRSADDAAMLKLSADQRWKKCPSCNMLVERSTGCNHMMCRCRTSFCYQCGKKYASNAPSANNVHGTPSCQCKLFDVPEENPELPPRAPQAPGDFDFDRQLAAAVGGHLLMHPPLARPIRGGRKVSRQRCWHSDSLDDCPRADRCWFWHDEDDEA